MLSCSAEIGPNTVIGAGVTVGREPQLPGQLSAQMFQLDRIVVLMVRTFGIQL